MTRPANPLAVCGTDVVDFIRKKLAWEEVVAGSHDGNRIVVKSEVKPKLESITLSPWSIANLALLHRLLGDGELRDQVIVDYLSYTTKIYQLTQWYENASVYFSDCKYPKLQATHNFRWGTDIPHSHTMQLTPRAPCNNVWLSDSIHAKPAHRFTSAGPVRADDHL